MTDSKTKKDVHINAVSELMTTMQQMRIHILHFPSKRNMLLAQSIDAGLKAMKKNFIKATLDQTQAEKNMEGTC